MANITLFAQVVRLIPWEIIQRLVKKHSTDRCRVLPWQGLSMKHRQGNDKYLDTESSSPTHKGSIFYHVRLSIGRAGLLPLRPTATMRRTSTRSFLIRVKGRPLCQSMTSPCRDARECLVGGHPYKYWCCSVWWLNSSCWCSLCRGGPACPPI